MTELFTEQDSLPRHLTHPNPDVYLSDNFIVLDYETTNEDYGDPCNPSNRLLLACYRKPCGEYVRTFGSEHEQRRLLQDIQSSSFILAQNAKFELGWLKRCGLDLTKVVVYDPVIAQYVYDGNRKQERNLNALARLYGVPGKLGPVSRMIDDLGICPSTIVPEWLERYCVQDVRTTYEIFIKQRQLMKERGLLPAIYTKCLFTPALADIEFNGMQLDADRVAVVARKLRNDYNTIDRELKTYCGGANLASPKQMASLLYDTLGFAEPLDHRRKPIRTDSGARTTNAKHLKKLVPKTAKQKKFLELYFAANKLDTKINMYLKKFEECIANDGGLLRFKINQTVTGTQRTSSSGAKYKIQGQNMDRELKPLFKARYEGWEIPEADYEQLEYRVAIWWGNDDLGRYRISTGFDIHRHTANVMADAGEPPCGKHTAKDEQCIDCRQEAKERCFPLDTMILTPRGWKGYNEVSVGDTVINYDPVSGLLVNDTIRRIAAPHKQEVISMGHKNWNVRSTGEHRWYCTKRTDHGAGGRTYDPVVAVTNEIGGSHRIITSANYVGGTSGVTPDEAALLAWCYSDGNVRIAVNTGKTSQGAGGARQAYEVTLIQKEGKPQEVVIDELLQRLTVSSKKTIDNRGICRWKLSSPDVRAVFRRAGISGPLVDHSSLVLSFSSTAREAWLEAVCLAEGHKRHGGEYRVAQNSGPFCEAIKLAASLCGKKVGVHKYPMKYNGNVHECITLGNTPYVGGARLVKGSLGVQDVWCVETNNKTVVIKQGETITISGNTFKPTYGGSSGTPAERAYYKLFKEEHAGIAAVQEQWKQEVVRTKQLKLATGMVFYWPDTVVERSGWITNSTKISNYPNQYFAGSEIVPIGVTFLWHRMKAANMQSFLVNTVHDSAVPEVHPDEKELYKKLAKTSLTQDVVLYLDKTYGITFDVPLSIEFKSGRNWAEGKDWANKYLKETTSD
jgi:DNA polymerase I-like protein with 3'-5' exonuclease and polymerase domains